MLKREKTEEKQSERREEGERTQGAEHHGKGAEETSAPRERHSGWYQR